MLILSLISVVVVATAGLGRVFDQLYVSMAARENTHYDDRIEPLKALGTTIAMSLNAMPEPDHFIAHWQGQTDYSASLLSWQDIALPAALRSDLQSGAALVLETHNTINFYYALPDAGRVFVMKAPRLAEAQNLSMNYFFTLFFYLLLMCLMAAWLYPLIRQLITLRKTALLFGQGDLGQRVKVHRLSYIKDIEQEFNAMAQKIENLVNDVKLLSSAVSHDLRTPLAKIRFGLDTLEETECAGQRRQYLKKINGHMDDMTDLTEALLRFARLDQSMSNLSRAPVALSDLVLECIASIEDEVDNIVFLPSAALAAGQDYRVMGEADTLKMMVSNLLNNAVRYHRKTVHINLVVEKSYIVLRIADDGQGITGLNTREIFKPFIRDKSYSNGFGLGLAIVQRVVDWHRGTVSVMPSRALAGAEFCVRLPKQHRTL